MHALDFGNVVDKIKVTLFHTATPVLQQTTAKGV
jgi:hypothetical protein